MSSKIESCRECGSKSLTWFAHNENKSGVIEGRLRTNEVSCVFVLGCDDCSETLRVVSADNIAARMNTAPPELAELQATIAQLETKLNNAINLDFERRETIAKLTAENDRLRQLPTRNALIKERDKLKDEIERLKGGQGEPVAWAWVDETGEHGVTLRWDVAKHLPYFVKSLYTSQPAPVSVPDGWKLVPIEPTELMVRRGDQNYSWSVAKIYSAMIADAPEHDDTARPSHANAPADSGTHPHNDGLDDYR